MTASLPSAWWLVVGLCCAAALYALVAALTMPRFGSASRVRAAARRARANGHVPVSVLKPLCGNEPRLFANLASFCEQNHPCFQLLFGVSSAVDPAIAVVRQLQVAYPHCDIELVIDSRVHGSNLKVSNLINMAARARHATLVVADSDIAVERDYLRIVTAPLVAASGGDVRMADGRGERAGVSGAYRAEARVPEVRAIGAQGTNAEACNVRASNVQGSNAQDPNARASTGQALTGHVFNARAARTQAAGPEARNEEAVAAEALTAEATSTEATHTRFAPRPPVGVVTCLYRARSVGGFWPRVGALFVNEWFAPSVRVAHTVGSREFGFGATLALSRATLERIGGFAALKDCLADDYLLARYARDHGLATVLAPVLVDTDVTEPTFAALWLRETRWLRTIRSVNPTGFASLPITFTSPWIGFGAALRWLAGPAGVGGAAWPGVPPAALTVLAASTVSSIIARMLLHARASAGWRGFWRDLPLVPLRDLLLTLQWLRAAFGSHVVWRGVRVPVANPDLDGPAVEAVEVSDGR